MTEDKDPYEGQFTATHMPDPEEVKARKGRNFWLGLALAAFVILVGLMTFIRLSSSDLSKGGFYYDAQDRPSESVQDLPAGMSEDEAGFPPNLQPVEQDDPETADKVVE